MIDPKGNCKETGTGKSIKKKEKQTLLNVGRLALRPLGETLATTCGLRFSVRSNDGHLGSISGPSQTSPPSTLKPVIGGLGIKAVDGRLRVGKPIPKVIQIVLPVVEGVDYQHLEEQIYEAPRAHKRKSKA